MSLRRFPSPPLGESGDRVELDTATSHHLLRVTRVARGALVVLFDGQRLARARLVDVSDDRAVCELVESPHHEDDLAVRILVIALLKGPAMEHALRMATELGATDVWPVRTDRTVPKGDKAERWRRVVLGAARQCGRSGPPGLRPLQSLEGALSELPPGVTGVVGAPGATRAAPLSGPAALFVGPEGGWSPAELALFAENGLRTVGLGRFVLRADTAVAAGLALLGS